MLLALIGANMLRESFGPEECDLQSRSFAPKVMIPMAIATSLDALAEAHNINGLTRAIIEGLITMKPEHQAAFIDLVNIVAAKVRNAEYEQVTPETVAAIIAAKAQDAQEPAEPSEPHTV